MNKIFYSPSAGGFFQSDVHGDAYPPDAIEISGELHKELLDGQSRGKVIAPGPAGAPLLSDPAVPARTWAGCQREAALALSRSDVTVLRCVESGVPVPPAWVSYRVALRGIVSASTGDPAQSLPERPEYPVGT